MTHSPGPWTMRTDGLLLDANGRALGEFTAFRSKGVTAEEVAGNRALIQAAPLFHEALKRLADDGIDNSRDPRTLIARAVLLDLAGLSVDSTNRNEQAQGSRDSTPATASSTQTKRKRRL